MLQPQTSAKYRPEDITYELFDIVPEEFYKNKFAMGKGLENALEIPIFRYEISFEKIRRLIADLQAFLPQGGKVLDVGCGSAPYAPTLLANVPGIVLYGVDMSETCLNQARENGVAFTKAFELTNPLQFEDEFFDAVFSMDLFGHIEFIHKDFLIKELARVTKKGGFGHHGVETAYIDYFNCNPKEKDDPIRQYVYIDGHIGAEPSEDICKRFSTHFSNVKPNIMALSPFLTLDAFATLFGPEFQQLVAEHSHPQAKQLGNIILGKLNQYFIALYSSTFGNAFQANDAPPKPVHEPKLSAKNRMLQLIQEYNDQYGVDFIPLPRQLFRPDGFSSISMQKQSAE